MKEVISTVIPMMPGNMNFEKSTPGASIPMAPLRPPPKTTRNSRGKAREVTMRILSRQNLNKSRYQIVYIPHRLFIALLALTCALVPSLMTAELPHHLF
ncbi:hypothetical protein ES703_78796 [subsurface metagenome]